MRFPESLLKELQERFSLDANAFLLAHQNDIPVSVRPNPLKENGGFGKVNRVPWTNSAFYLKERPIFTNDPLFHAGCYYVQEASSMFVEQAVKQTIDLSKKVMALDACAAPGGKSTLLTSLLNEDSLLVSNEVISTRVPVLVHNMAKWGSLNVVVSNNDPKDFARLPGFFDLIVADAPCSGSGLFRKQGDAIEHWSEDNVKHCSLRQQRILHDLIPALKENGILIYSTCSYSAEENEEVCDKLIAEHKLEPIQLKLQSEWGILESKSKEGAFGYRFFPHLLQGEGFFISCFKKTSGTSSVPDSYRDETRVRSTSVTRLSPEETKALKTYINSDDLTFSKHGDEITGHKTSVADEIRSLSTLKLKKLAVHAGQLKGKDFIPHPYLAYQNILNAEVNRVEVDTETALKYLRKQPFSLQGPQKGFELVTYKGFGLGWLKNLGNRINNYYPAEWRILKEVF